MDPCIGNTDDLKAFILASETDLVLMFPRIQVANKRQATIWSNANKVFTCIVGLCQNSFQSVSVTEFLGMAHLLSLTARIPLKSS